MTIDLRFSAIQEPVPRFIYEGIASYVEESNRYHYQPLVLRQLLAERHDVPVETIRLVAGIDHAILILCSTVGEQTHVFTPTYICYSDTSRTAGNGGVVRNRLVEHWSFERDEYRVDPRPLPGATLVFLANPNNPAGLTRRSDIVRLVEENEHAVVAIDEAYGSFHTDSMIDATRDHPNLVVLRSFSKDYALAGFRVGYVVAQPQVLRHFDLETAYFGMSHPSVGAAVAALENEGHYAAMRARIADERASCESLFREVGLTVVEGSINAVLLRFSDVAEATSFVGHLSASGFLVNHGNGESNIGLDQHFVRFAIGTPEQMSAFKDAVRTFG